MSVVRCDENQDRHQGRKGEVGRAVFFILLCFPCLHHQLSSASATVTACLVFSWHLVSGPVSPTGLTWEPSGRRVHSARPAELGLHALEGLSAFHPKAESTTAMLCLDYLFDNPIQWGRLVSPGANWQRSVFLCAWNDRSHWVTSAVESHAELFSFSYPSTISHPSIVLRFYDKLTLQMA